MDSLRLDLRYAVRSLLKRPGFTALAVLTLALGLGVNAVAFSAINALLLRPFRIPDAERIGWITLPGPGNGRGYVSPREFERIGREARSFEGIHAEGRSPVSWRGGDGAEQAWALVISSGYMQALEPRLVTGRLFTASDVSGDELPALVSQRFWKEKLGGPDSLADQRIVVNGRNFSVVGVIEDSFQGPGGLFAPDMWLPLARLDALNMPPNRRDTAWLTLFGRLAPGALQQRAEAELTVIAADLRPDEKTTPKRSARFYPMAAGHPDLVEIRAGIWIAFALVGLVLLIACFNVAALLMARTAERQQEISVRCAIGASRVRIIRQLTTEGLLLAAISGAAALVVAAWSADLLSTFSLPAPIPQRLQLGVDRTVVAFTALMVVIAGTLPGLLPAIQATRTNLVRSLRAESALGGRPSRTRNTLVVAQIAGSTLFIAGALLFVRSYLNTTAMHAGFDTERTAVLEVSPASHGYDDGKSRLLVDQLKARLDAVDRVSHVAWGDRVPFQVGLRALTEYSADGGDCATLDCRTAEVYGVSRGYFAALGIPLSVGRDFTADEVAGGTAVVVSSYMAAQLWPGHSAVGQRLRLGETGEPVQVVGVAADIKHLSMADKPAAYIYRPLRSSDYEGRIAVVVRTRGDAGQLLAPIRNQLRGIDPDVPPAALATMAERMKLPLWQARTTAGFFLICGALALVLATIGLFGVLYFSVSQRTREFGIRASLGATRGRVLTVVFREGLRLAVPGVILGAVAAYLGARLIGRMLFGLTATDPATFAATMAIEIAVTMVACALPAYRAMKVDPMVALRNE